MAFLLIVAGDRLMDLYHVPTVCALRLDDNQKPLDPQLPAFCSSHQ